MKACTNCGSVYGESQELCPNCGASNHHAAPQVVSRRKVASILLFVFIGLPMGALGGCAAIYILEDLSSPTPALMVLLALFCLGVAAALFWLAFFKRWR